MRRGPGEGIINSRLPAGEWEEGSSRRLGEDTPPVNTELQLPGKET